MTLLTAFGWTLLSFIFVLGIMIFIHELGHYLAAKWLKIRVDVFSLGFGPRLFGFRRGDTDYRISAIPLGGYVKMKGENFDEDLQGAPDEFLSRPKLHRFLVAVAGPAMNIGLAVLLLAGSYMVGVPVPTFLSEPPVVGYIAPDSPARDAGLLRGDRILAVAGRETHTWEELQLVVATTPDQAVPVRLLRDGEELEKVVRLGEENSTGTGYMGVFPETMTVVSRVDSGPAAEAGLRPGDIILSVRSGDRAATDHEGILAIIGASEGRPVEFVVRRGQEEFQRSITPVMMDGKARVGVVIGPVPRSDIRLERYGPLPALVRAVDRCYRLTTLTFRIIGKLVTGETSLKMMSGPIEIARFSGQAASQGLLPLIGFMSLVSLQLGIFNLLPIPILDGGVITLLAVEAVLGRDLSLKLKERIFQVGFIFLILLMSIVIFNDISKNISG